MREGKALNMEDLIYGKNPVVEALEAGHAINKLLILDGSKDKAMSKIVDKAKQAKVVVQFVNRKKLDQLTDGQNHQGVVAFIAPYAYSELEEIFGVAEQRGEAPFIIICDEVTDPHNLGSVIRTANAVGAHGVVIPKRRSAAVNATVVKTSCGAVEYVKVARVTNIVAAIKDMKAKGVWVAGTDMGAPNYTEQNLKGPIAIVIGNEGSGIGRLVKETCDFMVSLPMLGEVSSLNAAVAGAVVMYEVVRQRRLQ